jgi:hypothetical protein
MRDKPRETSVSRSAIPYPACAIKRMESRYGQLGRITYVMQICRRDQQVLIAWRESRRYLARLLRDLADMMPPVPKGKQKKLRAHSGPRGQGHGGYRTTQIYLGQPDALLHGSGGRFHPETFLMPLKDGAAS